MKEKKFRSCFAVDVSAGVGDVVITDSARCRWHVDTGNEEAASGFRSWLKDVFLKGVAQVPTVFEYETRGEPPDAENWILKFFNVGSSRLDG